MPAKTRPDQQLQVEAGDNSKYLAHNLAMFDWRKPNMRDEQQVEQRVKDYFQLCEQNDMKPSVAGLALAFDVDRNTIYRWANDGEGSKQLSDESRRTLKKAYKILNAQMEDYMQNGKINPVAGIFLMKNNMGYRDQQEITLKPDSQLGEQKEPDELQKKYLEDAYGGATIIEAETAE